MNHLKQEIEDKLAHLFTCQSALKRKEIDINRALINNREEILYFQFELAEIEEKEKRFEQFKKEKRAK